jgi:hypothetical protein
MSYHPGHGHVHVDNWAEFTLRTQTADPNPLNWPIAGSGSKVSFCLINLGDCTSDYGYCRDTNDNVITMADIPNAPFGVVSGCGLDQGIYTGMLDIYSSGLPGMFIDLTGVCNGNYYIVSVTDPDNNFLETNDNNNWAIVPVTLTQQTAPVDANMTFSQTGNTYDFNFTLTSGTALNYLWDFGDGSTNSISTSPSHTYAASGTYTVTLIVNGACNSDTLVETLLFTGMSNAISYKDFNLSAAPNPTNGSTLISFTLPETGKASLEILNIQGQQLMSTLQLW